MPYPNAPSTSQWRRLLDSTLKIRDLKPWTWMDEADIFGIQHPLTGELNLVSIMGAPVEYHAVNVYRGVQGITGFLD